MSQQDLCALLRKKKNHFTIIIPFYDARGREREFSKIINVMHNRCTSLVDFPKERRSFFLPEMWRKQCVSTAMARPEASDVERRTEETEAPMPAPAAAPHTMNT
jgi:hypothetical protein